VFCPAGWLQIHGSAQFPADSPSAYQQREQLFTARNFPGVLTGGQAEDPPENPGMSTGTMIFTQQAVPDKRGLQSGKKYFSLFASRQGNRKNTRVP